MCVCVVGGGRASTRCIHCAGRFFAHRRTPSARTRDDSSASGGKVICTFAFPLARRLLCILSAASLFSPLSLCAAFSLCECCACATLVPWCTFDQARPLSSSSSPLSVCICLSVCLRVCVRVYLIADCCWRLVALQFFPVHLISAQTYIHIFISTHQEGATFSLLSLSRARTTNTHRLAHRYTPQPHPVRLHNPRKQRQWAQRKVGRICPCGVL